MKKEDIINKIMDEFDIARIDAAEIVNNIFSILRNSLIKGKHINISEFGKFDVNYKKGENEKILQTVSFSPVKKFSYDVNDSFNNLEPVTVAFITNFKEEDYPDVDMEDYEEVIDEIDEKEFIQSRVTVVEDKAKQETKEKFKEIFKEESKEEAKQEPFEKKSDKIDKLADDRRKSFFDSERYRLNKTEPTEETISDKILSGTIDVIEARDVIDKQEIFEIPKEALPDFTFIDREEPEEPLVVEFKERIEDIKEPETTENETETTEVHGYVPSEKEILDFERIREELNNKIKETFGDIVTPEPVTEDEVQEEIQEEGQPVLTEDVSEIESKDPEIRTPEESNALEEDLITQQETSEETKDETKDETKIDEPKSEEQSFRDMFEEKEKLFDERDEILKEIESKISEDFAKLDEDDFKDIDNDTIKKIEDINKATEEKLKAQAPDDDIKIPDFDFKNLFKDSVSESSIPEAELPQEEESEEIIEGEIKEQTEREKREDFSFEGSDILIPEEIKQLHEEIQTVKPFEGLEAKSEEILFKNGGEEDVKFDFFKDYDDVFENKDGDTEMRIVHPTVDTPMPYPKKDLTDEQREGSKIFSLSIMVLIGIVIAVFAGIYFLLSSDLFQSKPVPVLVDSVKKEQQVVPGVTDSAKQNQQSKDTTSKKDTVKTSSQQTQIPSAQNNQTANPEESQYRKLNPGEEEQINDPANNVVYIRTADGVFIQTGSYKDKAVAEGKANALKKTGLQNVSVVEANLGDKGVYYRVRVGKYPTVQEAKNNSQKVKI
jgi:nucleoid DNA-binding protein